MHLMDLMGCIDQREHSNASMVRRLQATGALSTPAIINAFRAVDRGDYISTQRPELNYADMPIKVGYVHLSAPSIYAAAAEALDISPGDSFLHLGSGTGYLSTIVAELQGACTINHGVEVNEDLVELASSLASKRGLDHLDFHAANAFQVDIGASMKYDKVYVSAAALSEHRALFQLLRVGGVLVGPFEVGGAVEGYFGGQHQNLIRVSRTGPGEGDFTVEKLQAVQFAPLRHPGAEGLRHLPRLVLQSPPWTTDTHARFPATFKAQAVAVLLANRQADCPLSVLPKELLLRVLAELGASAFDKDEPTAWQPPGGDAAGPSSLQGARGAVRGGRATPLSFHWWLATGDSDDQFDVDSDDGDLAEAEDSQEEEGDDAHPHLEDMQGGAEASWAEPGPLSASSASDCEEEEATGAASTHAAVADATPPDEESEAAQGESGEELPPDSLAPGAAVRQQPHQPSPRGQATEEEEGDKEEEEEPDSFWVHTPRAGGGPLEEFGGSDGDQEEWEHCEEQTGGDTEVQVHTLDEDEAMYHDAQDKGVLLIYPTASPPAQAHCQLPGALAQASARPASGAGAVLKSEDWSQVTPGLAPTPCSAPPAGLAAPPSPPASFADTDSEDGDRRGAAQAGASEAPLEGPEGEEDAIEVETPETSAEDVFKRSGRGAVSALEAAAAGNRRWVSSILARRSLTQDFEARP